MFGNILNRIKNSRDGRVLVSNFAYLSLLQVAGYIFPLLTLPYLAEVIGVEGFGKIAFAAAVIVWVQTIADWGFNYTATRDVAKNREDAKRVSEIFSNVFWARCMLMLFAFMVLLLLVVCVSKFRENSAIRVFKMVSFTVIFLSVRDEIIHCTIFLKF